MSTPAAEGRASAPRPAPAAGGNVLTRKLGPLPTWVWLGLIGAAGVGFIWVRNRQAANAASTASTGSATTSADTSGTTLDGASAAALQSEVQQLQGEASTPGPAGATGPPGPPGAPGSDDTTSSAPEPAPNTKLTPQQQRQAARVEARQDTRQAARRAQTQPVPKQGTSPPARRPAPVSGNTAAARLTPAAQARKNARIAARRKG